MFDVWWKSRKKRQEWESQTVTGKITRGHVGRETEKTKTGLRVVTNLRSTENLRIFKILKRKHLDFCFKIDLYLKDLKS